MTMCASQTPHNQHLRHHNRKCREENRFCIESIILKQCGKRVLVQFGSSERMLYVEGGNQAVS